MANQLKMADVQCILTLRDRGWSRRRIARELGLDRETVGRHLRLSAELVCDGGTAGSWLRLEIFGCITTSIAISCCMNESIWCQNINLSTFKNVEYQTKKLLWK